MPRAGVGLTARIGVSEICLLIFLSSDLLSTPWQRLRPDAASTRWSRLSDVIKGRAAPKDIDRYIAGFPPDVRGKLTKLRAAIRRAAPQAKETIKYQMPTFTQHGNLVHFAAYKNHIGFYPAPRAIEEFRAELVKYEGSKGAIRFPLDRPLPLGLIGRIVRFRVQQDHQRAAARKKKR